VRAAAALLLAAALACSSCTASPSWGKDRLLDLTDIVDLRYGTGLGLGVQADALLLLGTGVGYSDVSWSRAWYGRHAVDVGSRKFVGAVLYSAFGDYEYPGDAARTWCNVLLLNIASIGPAQASGDENWFERDQGPPILERLRCGATLFLPGVHGGLYLNVGEAVDFLLGVFFLDPCTDDGQPKLPG
jgi:hypothetical protein